jgi:hypothetical protein
MCHAGHMVLDLRIQSLAKLQDDIGTFKVVCTINHFVKFVNILIDGSRTLEVLRGFEVRPRILDLILGAEFRYKFLYEISPRRVEESAHFMVGSHVSIDKSSCMVTFHEQECPHYLCMIISKLGRHHCDV